MARLWFDVVRSTTELLQPQLTGAVEAGVASWGRIADGASRVIELLIWNIGSAVLMSSDRGEALAWRKRRD
jgi:hypothetical protein